MTSSYHESCDVTITEELPIQPEVSDLQVMGCDSEIGREGWMDGVRDRE